MFPASSRSRKLHICYVSCLQGIRANTLLDPINGVSQQITTGLVVSFVGQTSNCHPFLFLKDVFLKF